ncbi:MAG: ABC transporter permease [Isosphaeraceae bacterium]
MTQQIRRSIGMALAALAAAFAPASAAEKAPALPGGGPGYEAIGRIPVMHEGRIKPLDTVARTELKLIHGREAIEILGPDDKPVARWSPIAAFWSWTAAPEYWDDQPFILVEYLPLKRKLFAAEVRGRMAAIADEPSAPEAARKRARELAGHDEISAEEIKGLALAVGLSDGDRKALEALAKRLGPQTKYYSPRDLEEARITIDGRAFPFRDWANDVRRKKAELDAPIQAFKREKLNELEQKVIEVGDRLSHYRNIRGDGDRMLASIDQFLPRPSGKAFIQYAGKIYRKLTDPETRASGLGSLTPLEEDTAFALKGFLTSIQAKNRKEPGVDDDFDREFSTWLAEDSEWMPLRAVLEAEPADLAAAGFPGDDTSALRTALQQAREAEAANPGTLALAQGEALESAFRSLGEALGDAYPSPEAIRRETRFNAFAPFYRAPMAYGVGFLLLVLSLTIPARGNSGIAPAGGALYATGLLAFAAGIGLEVYGFYARILISGWAPVTNMYETVVWVGLVAALLGLVLEAIYRRRYIATCACGAALLCTLVAAAAGSSILDPSIKGIPAVLRSNYWLTIHVLTIVSSYAAFALAMVIGLAATLSYLTAIYKRPIGVANLFVPAIVGLPVALLGIGGYLYTKSGASWGMFSDPAFVLAYGLLGLGGIAVALAPIPALIGEAISAWRLERMAAARPLLADDAIGQPMAESVRARPPTWRAAWLPGHQPWSTRSAPRVLANAETDLRDERARGQPPTSQPLAEYRLPGDAGGRPAGRHRHVGGIWADVSWGRFWGWDPKSGPDRCSST